MIRELIWRNLWRNKRRSLITMASVTFAVMLAISMKSLQKGIFDNLIKNVVSFYTGYIQVHKNGYSEEQVLDNSFEFSDSIFNSIKNDKHISGAVARIESFALASSETTTHGCMVVGTQPEEENNLTGLQSKLISGKYFSDNDNSVIITEGLAKRLLLSVNDTMVLLGQGYHGNTAASKFPIIALAHFGSPVLNESLVFLPLKAAQSFLSAENKITTIALNIDNPTELEASGKTIRQLVGKEFEVLTWKEMMPDIEAHIRGDNISFYIYIGVLYLLIAFGIFGTVLMMLAERQYEFGMLLAIGMKKQQIAVMLMGEIFLLSILGTIFGMVISFPVVKYFELNPVKISGKIAEAYKNFGFEALWPAALDINIFITQAIIVLCMALLIGIYPMTKVKGMDAIALMKR